MRNGRISCLRAFRLCFTDYSFTTQWQYPTAPTNMTVTKTTTVWCNIFVTDFSEGSPPDTAMLTFEDLSSFFFRVAFDPAASALGTIQRELIRTAARETPAHFVDALSIIPLPEDTAIRASERRTVPAASGRVHRKRTLVSRIMGGRNLSRPMKENKAGLWTKKTQVGAPITIELATRPVVTKTCLEKMALMVIIGALRNEHLLFTTKRSKWETCGRILCLGSWQRGRFTRAVTLTQSLGGAVFPT